MENGRLCGQNLHSRFSRACPNDAELGVSRFVLYVDYIARFEPGSNIE